MLSLRSLLGFPLGFHAPPKRKKRTRLVGNQPNQPKTKTNQTNQTNPSQTNQIRREPGRAVVLPGPRPQAHVVGLFDTFENKHLIKQVYNSKYPPTLPSPSQGRAAPGTTSGLNFAFATLAAPTAAQAL